MKKEITVIGKTTEAALEDALAQLGVELSDITYEVVEEAKKVGLENLKGHKVIGGLRASIYNAMPLEGIVRLVEFMKKFEEQYNV